MVLEGAFVRVGLGGFIWVWGLFLAVFCGLMGFLFVWRWFALGVFRCLQISKKMPSVQLSWAGSKWLFILRLSDV